MRFYLTAQNDVIQVTSRVESDDRELVGKPHWSLTAGERLFSVPYEALLLAAREVGYIDINQDGQACDESIPDEHWTRRKHWKDSVIFTSSETRPPPAPRSC